MQNTPAPQPNTQALDALTASMRAWALGLVTWLIEMVGGETPLGRALKSQVRADLRQAGRDLRRLVFVIACARLDWAKQRKSRTRHAFAPLGFRRTRMRGSPIRRLTRGFLKGLHQGTLAQRIARLRDFLDDIQNLAKRLARRIERGLAGAQLSPIAPPALLFATNAAPARPACADSS